LTVYNGIIEIQDKQQLCDSISLKEEQEQKLSITNLEDERKPSIIIAEEILPIINRDQIPPAIS